MPKHPPKGLLCTALVCLLGTSRGATIVIEDDGHLILEDNVTLVVDDTDDAEAVVLGQPRRGLHASPDPTCTLERPNTRCMRSEGYHGYWPPSPGPRDADAYTSPEACAKHMFAALRAAHIKAPVPILYRSIGSDTACLSCWHQPTELDNYMWKTTTFLSEPASHIYRCSFANV